MIPATEHSGVAANAGRLQARPAALLGAGVICGVDRVPAGRSGLRASSRPDEDAVTLAAEAAARALPESIDSVGAIIFVSTTGACLEGGSSQMVPELLGLQGEVFTLDLTTSRRDGLAAIRVASALASSGSPVLLCAAHVDPSDDRSGSGAVALLLGSPSDGVANLATLTPVASSARELRDNWRLPASHHMHQADRSFVQSVGTELLTRDLLTLVPNSDSIPTVVIGPDAKTSADLTRSLHGPEDTVTRFVGNLGAAHPLLRLLATLDSEHLMVSVSNGLAEAVHVTPGTGSAELAASVRDSARSTGALVDQPMVSPIPADFDPFSSGPRSWRDRDVDFRLKGVVGAADIPERVPGRFPPTGTVIAWTRDHLYPGADITEMVVVRMDEAGQFYGQVSMGEHVAMGDRVQLVPRRLHQGGNVIQYFWKVKPCR